MFIIPLRGPKENINVKSVFSRAARCQPTPLRGSTASPTHTLTTGTALSSVRRFDLLPGESANQQSII